MPRKVQTRVIKREANRYREYRYSVRRRTRIYVMYRNNDELLSRGEVRAEGNDLSLWRDARGRIENGV